MIEGEDLSRSSPSIIFYPFWHRRRRVKYAFEGINPYELKKKILNEDPPKPDENHKLHDTLNK